MKLYHNPISPFARKCRVIAQTLNVALEEISTIPTQDEGLKSVNPLAKIPALVLDDGTAMYDSRVICEYLDHLGGNHFFPRNSARWPALTLQALGDGMADAAVAYAMLGREATPPEAARARNRNAVVRALDVLESTTLANPPLIGEVAVACALSYVDLRLSDLDWRATRPRLAAWHKAVSDFPALRATEAPPPQ